MSRDPKSFVEIFCETVVSGIFVNLQTMKFSIKDFFNKHNQIRKRGEVWSHLLKKSLMENFSFWAVSLPLLLYLFRKDHIDRHFNLGMFLSCKYCNAFCQEMSSLLEEQILIEGIWLFIDFNFSLFFHNFIVNN